MFNNVSVSLSLKRKTWQKLRSLSSTRVISKGKIYKYCSRFMPESLKAQLTCSQTTILLRGLFLLNFDCSAEGFLVRADVGTFIYPIQINMSFINNGLNLLDFVCLLLIFFFYE